MYKKLSSSCFIYIYMEIIVNYILTFVDKREILLIFSTIYINTRIIMKTAIKIKSGFLVNFDRCQSTSSPWLRSNDYKVKHPNIRDRCTSWRLNTRTRAYRRTACVDRMRTQLRMHEADTTRVPRTTSELIARRIVLISRTYHLEKWKGKILRRWRSFGRRRICE